MIVAFRLIIIGFVIAVCWAGSRVSLTVYNEDLALIRDVRSVQFNRGENGIIFDGIADRIEPSTVHFVADEVKVLEQNFDYDLISPERLRQKYSGSTVSVVDADGNSVIGTLLPTNSRSIVLRAADGSLQSLDLENVSQIRYPALPERLQLRPSLRWTVVSEQPGSRDAELSYLTRGLSWRANYVLAMDSTRNALLTSAITLKNYSGMDFENADLQLVAGVVSQSMKSSPLLSITGLLTKTPSFPAEFHQESLHEYHLYTLRAPTAISDRQEKQIRLYEPAACKVKPYYLALITGSNSIKVMSYVALPNTAKNGLGKPLPCGLVRVFQQSADGAPQFIGDGPIGHTAKGETAKIEIGETSDISVSNTHLTCREKRGKFREDDYQVILQNRKSEAVAVTVRVWFVNEKGWKIARSNFKCKKLDSSKVEFEVPVKPGREAVLNYTMQIR